MEDAAASTLDFNLGKTHLELWELIRYALPADGG